MSLSLENAIVEVQNLYDRAQSVIEFQNASEKAKELYYQYQTSEDMAILYLKILSTFYWKQEETEWAEITKEAKKVFNQHKSSENLAKQYFNLLNNLCWKEEGNRALSYSAKEAKRVYNQHYSSDAIAKKYQNLLNLLSLKQDQELEVEEISKEAERIYGQHYFSDDYAKGYISVLGSLLGRQKEKNDRKETADKAKNVYNSHESSADVAKEYLNFLLDLCWNQELNSVPVEIVKEAKRVYDKHYSSAFVAGVFLDFIIIIIRFWMKVSEIRNIIGEIFDILQKHPQLIDMVEIFIDQLMSSSTTEKNYLDKAEEILKIFAGRGEKKYLERSKYSLIFEVYGDIADDEMKKLIEIFSLVQKIKEQLIVKKPKKLKFGHYTSGKVLQIHLSQKENKKIKYAIESKSRLNNVNYMNDPSEGKVLNQFLDLDSSFQQLVLKPSPWFLMSLTTAIDKLEMWAQYGDQAKGVCLLLNPDDFDRGSLFFSPKWFKLESLKEISNVEDNIEINNRLLQNIHGDYIYRIGYLSPQIKENGLLIEENNTCLDKTEIEIINKSLMLLKEKIQGIDVESIFYEKVDECLEEIRYLFKSEDYSYESELRVLKYMPLEPDNPKIKIDESGEFAKLYIERDNPIQIAEVIFGPKFQNPENVTPLLHLLDKNIKFSQSKIPFK